MELIVALLIGVLTGSGVWLILRPRTYQVILGLALISYGVDAPCHLRHGLGTWQHAAILDAASKPDFSRFADPLPQALVLTAIVISFATTALFLVVLLAARGLTGTDHVDGEEREE